MKGRLPSSFPHLFHATDLIGDDNNTIHILSNLVHQASLLLHPTLKCCCRRMKNVAITEDTCSPSSTHLQLPQALFQLPSWKPVLLWQLSLHCLAGEEGKERGEGQESSDAVSFFWLLAWNISLDRQIEKIPAQPELMYQSVSTARVHMRTSVPKCCTMQLDYLTASYFLLSRARQSTDFEASFRKGVIMVGQTPSRILFPSLPPLYRDDMMRTR